MADNLNHPANHETRPDGVLRVREMKRMAVASSRNGSPVVSGREQRRSPQSGLGHFHYPFASVFLSP